MILDAHGRKRRPVYALVAGGLDEEGPCVAEGPRPEQGCQRLWLLGQRRPGAGPLLGKDSVNQGHVVVDLGDLFHQLHVLAHMVHKAQAQHNVKAAKLAEVYRKRSCVTKSYLSFSTSVNLKTKFAWSTCVCRPSFPSI